MRIIKNEVINKTVCSQSLIKLMNNEDAISTECMHARWCDACLFLHVLTRLVVIYTNSHVISCVVVLSLLFYHR